MQISQVKLVQFPKSKSKSNTQKFSDLIIRGLPFSQARKDYYDSLPPLAGIPGILGVRVGARSKVFFILNRNARGGKQKRYTLGR